MGNIIVRHINELPKLEPSEQRVLLFLGTYFDGEAPSNYAIAKLTGMDKRTVSEAVEGLKRRVLNKIGVILHLIILYFTTLSSCKSMYTILYCSALCFSYS